MRKILVLIVLVGVFSLFPPQVFAFNFPNELTSLPSLLQNKIERFFLQLPGPKSGEAVLRQTGWAMTEVESLTLKSQTSFLLSDGQEQIAEVNLGVNGPIVVQPLSLQITKQDLNLQTDVVLERVSLKSDFDLHQNGETTYIRFNQMPVLPALDLRKLTGEWYQIQNTEIDGGEDTSRLSAKQSEDIFKRFLELLKESEISQAQKERKEDNSIFVIDVKIPGEVAASYFNDVRQISEQSASAFVAETQMMEKEKVRIKIFGDAINDLELQLWVDRDTYYLTHLDLKLEINTNQLSSSLTSGEDDHDEENIDVLNEIGVPIASGSSMGVMGVIPSFEAIKTIKIKSAFDFNDYNQPVEFTTPESAMDLQTVFGQLMWGGLGGGGNIGTHLLPPFYPQETPVELKTLTPKQKLLIEQLNQ